MTARPASLAPGRMAVFFFFGADRVAVNGAKDMGFWFFKRPGQPERQRHLQRRAHGP